MGLTSRLELVRNSVGSNYLASSAAAQVRTRMKSLVPGWSPWMTFDKCLKSSSSELPLQVQGSSGQDGLTFSRSLTSSSSELAASAACKCTRRKLVRVNPPHEYEVNLPFLANASGVSFFCHTNLIHDCLRQVPHRGDPVRHHCSIVRNSQLAQSDRTSWILAWIRAFARFQ